MMSSPSFAKHTIAASTASTLPAPPGQQQASTFAKTLTSSGTTSTLASSFAANACLPATATPDLADDSAMRDHITASGSFALDERDDFPVTAFDRDERASVQNHHTASGPDAMSPRMTMARRRTLRAAASISSSVITPCSASYAVMKSSNAC